MWDITVIHKATKYKEIHYRIGNKNGVIILSLVQKATSLKKK